jgi:ABC-type Co2+ transport system permease subunit
VTQRRLLQMIIAVLALVPIGAGLAGVLIGPAFLVTSPPWSNDLDSHVRFLSGVFLVLGLAWWSCIPHIETKTERIWLLGVATFVGGLARLYSLILVCAPTTGHLIGLGLELIAVPLILLWQARLSADPRREA